MNKTQQLYIANWHDSFVQYIQQIQSFIVTIEALPEATDEDKKAFGVIKMMLNGKDVQDVERDLAIGNIKKSTLDKIAKMHKDLLDEAIEHLSATPLWKLFLKELTRQRIERDKEAELMRLDALKIPLIEE